MPSVNKILLMGNLTRDPELKHIGSNSTVCNFGLATNRKYKSRDGEQRDEVMFIEVEAWGKTAEALNTYLKKGSPIFIEGRLKLDQWDDRETGKKRSKHAVMVESFEFMGSKETAR